MAYSKSSMRILQVHKYFHERDGAGRYMLSLMRLLEAAGHVTAPFAMQTHDNLPTPWGKYFVSPLDTRAVGGPVASVKQTLRALWSREAARKLDGLMYAFAPDVMHVHNIYTHLSPSVLAVARRRGVPVVMTVHDYALMSANYALWDGDHALPFAPPSVMTTARTRFVKGSTAATFALEAVRRLHHKLHAYDGIIDHYLAPSECMKRALIMIGVDEDRITVAYPPIALPDVGERNDEGYVLFVGRLEAYKGVATLIDAMRQHPGVSLRIVGDGPERAALELQAKGMRNVMFVGFQQGEALWAEYRGARCLVVPSLWYEPFGLVALEGLARGVPTIVSDRGGLPEIVEDGVSGFVFAAGEAGELAEKIGRLLADDSLAAHLGAAGRVRAAKIGDPKAHLAKVLDVYKGVLEAM